MNGQPLVSVVIATYNMGHYLLEAIESVLAQSWANIEIIVVDDGSTDDTSRRMQRFKDSEKVRYYSTQNQGQPKAKNKGMQEANGDFIAFCDADDIWHPEKLTIQIPLFENNRVGIVYSEVSYIDQNGKKINKDQPYKRYSGKVTDRLILKNFIPFGTAVIRRECLERSGYFDENLPMGIDWDLWLRYSVTWHFKYTPRKTYFYRIWSGQMSKNYRGRYENAFKILDKFIKENPSELTPYLRSKAWADMYLSRGIYIAKEEKVIGEPLGSIVQSLRCNFFYFEAWKELLKIVIRHFLREK